MPSGKIALNKGVFNLDARLLAYYGSIAENLTIEGHGDATVLDTTALNSANGHIYFGGAETAVTTTLSAAGDKGSYTIAVTSATGLAAGNYIKVYSTAVWGGAKKGEIHKITNVAGTTLTLREPLADDYATADTASIVQINMIENLTLRNFKVLGSESNADSCGLYLKYVAHLKLENITFKDSPYANCMLDNVIYADINNCTTIGADLAGYGYGFMFIGACRNIDFHDNQSIDCIKLVTASGGTGYGVSRFINVHDNQASGSGQQKALYDSHSEGEYHHVHHNTGYGAAIGVSNPHTLIEHNLIYLNSNPGTQSEAFIHIGGTVPNYVDIIENELFWNAQSASGNEWGISLYSDATTITHCRINRNRLHGFKYGIRAHAARENLEIDGNEILDPITGGVGIYYDNHVANAKRIAIKNNFVDGNGLLVYGIQVQSNDNYKVEDLEISGNTAKNCTTSGVYVNGTDDAANAFTVVKVINNHLHDDQGVATQDNGLKVNARINTLHMESNFYKGNTAAATSIAGTITTQVDETNIAL